MTLRILAIALLTTVANAQHPTPGAEPKPAAKQASDAKPEHDAARARRLLALADLDGDGVISPRERQWVHMVLNQREHRAKDDDDKPDAARPGAAREVERARREKAQEHADEVRRAKEEKQEEARGKEARKPPPARVKQR